MKRFSFYGIILIALICLFYVNKNRWKGEGGDNWKTTICSDGHGYYAYLPCIFIYRKFDFQKINEEENKLHPYLVDNLNTLFPVYEGKQYDKCFAGVSVLLSPFFLLALFLSRIFGFDTNGYSVLFQAGVSIGALFYLIIGLVFIRKLLQEYGLKDRIITMVLIALVFATNLLYYTTIEPSMSHVYSFGLTAVFLYFTKRAIVNFNLKYMMLAIVSLSLLLITRPVDMLIVLFIPFLAGSFEAFKQYLKNVFRPGVLAVCLPIALAIISIQLVLWHIQTGHYFIWNYRRVSVQQSETFDFTNPHFFGILLSFRNGWLIYTPFMLLSFCGLILLLKRNIFEFWGFLFFFVVTTYILSSWWCWYYAGYGLRAFIDFYPVFILPLAKFIDFFKSKIAKFIIFLFIILCAILNLIQTYQFRTGIMSNGDMDKQKYERIFLKTGKRFRGILSRPGPEDFNFFTNASFSNDFEQNSWGGNDNITTVQAHSGNHSAFVDEKHQFSPTLSLKCGNLPQNQHLYIYTDLWAFMPDYVNDAQFVVSIEDSTAKGYFYNSVPLKSYIDDLNTWQEEDFSLELPPFKSNSDKLKVYIFATKGMTYIDDVIIKFGTLQANKSL